MQPEDYEIADVAVIEPWLADAALTATLEGLFTWRGFFGELDDAGDSLSEPSLPPALPAAGAEWRLRYSREPGQTFEGGVTMREALADITLRIQPALVAADAARSKVRLAAQAIKTRLSAQATAEALVINKIPTVRVTTQDDDWPGFRVLIGLRLGET